jgi:DNA-binding NarL/FixJ family response regulator
LLGNGLRAGVQEVGGLAERRVERIYVVDGDRILFTFDRNAGNEELLARVLALKLRAQRVENYRLMMEVTDIGWWSDLLNRAEKVKEETKQFNLSALTPRQRDVMRGLVDGLGNKEIAADLHITLRTVKFHVSALLLNFNCRSRQDLCALMYNTGVCRADLVCAVPVG